MSYSKEAYEYALNTVNERREAAVRRCELKRDEIHRTLPELGELERRIRETGLKAVQAATAFNGTDELERLQQTYLSLDNKRQSLIAASGLTDADFQPQFYCKKCSDTGYRDGYICSCAKELARRFEFDRLSRSMPLADSTFAAFDLSFYSGEQRANMEQVLNFCKAYAEDFSYDSPSLLFYGKTGLGKTHLSLAITNEVLSRGFGVMYSSAQNFLERLEKEHFGRADGDTLALLTECDLLILDDLGAEFQTAFTVSAIYNVINSRIMNSRPTIISTNLTPAEITKIYGERVMSRILGSFRRFEFTGADIRQQKMLRARG